MHRGKVVPAETLAAALEHIYALVRPTAARNTISILELEHALTRAYTPLSCCLSCGASVDAQTPEGHRP